MRIYLPIYSQSSPLLLELVLFIFFFAESCFKPWMSISLEGFDSLEFDLPWDGETNYEPPGPNIRGWADIWTGSVCLNNHRATISNTVWRVARAIWYHRSIIAITIITAKVCWANLIVKSCCWKNHKNVLWHKWTCTNINI